jgi:hypothetical protein
MKLKVIVHEAEEGGYWPSIPGCATQGETAVFWKYPMKSVSGIMKTQIISYVPLKLFVSVVSVLLLLYVVSVATVQRDEPAQAARSQTSNTPDVKHIISEFTVGETELRKSFDQYGYHRDLLIQTVKKGKVTGEYHRITQLILGKDGKPEEKVLSFPRPSLTEVTVTPEDLECLSPNYHFTLGESNADKYEFTYVGSVRTADRDFYVFDVRPKRVGAKELLFKGRVWVSVSDLRVIKMRGQCVAKTNQSFPILEINRSMVDGHYLFPSHAFADDEVHFETGDSAHLLIEVRYTDYVKLH